MPPPPFYTRSPRLAFLKELVAAHATFSFDREEFARIFAAVDKHCGEIFPSEEREQWFSPLFLGGIGVGHTPPHIINAVYGIYSDLAAGCPEPVSFPGRPLNMDGTTALHLAASAGFLVESCLGSAAPVTDLLVRVRARLPGEWLSDIYGTPPLKEVVRVGWNMAAESLPTAISGGYMLLHEASRRVLDPMAPGFTEEEQELFFAEPALESRLARYRNRVAEQIGIPLPVLQRNHDNARLILLGCLGYQGGPAASG